MIVWLDNDVLILGDINADLGLGGGPMASTPLNKQGKTLMQYPKRWNFQKGKLISMLVYIVRVHFKLDHSMHKFN